MLEISFIKMREKGVNFIVLILSVILIAFTVQSLEIRTTTFVIESEDSIETKSVLLKFSLNKGNSINKNISILSVSGGEIDLEIEGIQEGVSINQSNFILEKNEEREIEINFNTSSIEEGIYVGQVKISGGGEEEFIPIIFEVESKDVFFDGNLEIPSSYSEIFPGDKIIVQLNVFDLFSGGGIQEGLGSSSVDIEYNVHDLHGNTIISENENFVIDSKVLLSKTMIFPKEISTGQYVVSAIIRYKSSIGIATELFSISEKRSENLVNFDTDFTNSTAILILIGFIFLVLILFFVYIIRDRDRMVLELRGHNNKELSKHRIFLKSQARVAKRKKSSNKKKIDKEVREKIKKLKEKHKERIKEFKRLKKKGEINIMKRKLDEWKKKKYNVGDLDYKLKGLNTNEMKNIIGKWKKKYKS